MKAHRYLALAVGMIAVTIAGCDSPNTIIWKAQTKSPDGGWLALAHSESTSGPGNNARWTTVEIKQNTENGSPEDILFLDEDEQSVRDLEMNWVSPSHLDITYRGNPSILFHAAKAFGLDVTVEHLTN